MSDNKLITPTMLISSELQIQELAKIRDNVSESYQRFFDFLASIASCKPHNDMDVESYIIRETKPNAQKLMQMGSFNRIKDVGVKTWFTTVMTFMDTIVYMDYIFNMPTIASAMFHGQAYGHLTVDTVISTAHDRGVVLASSPKTFQAANECLKFLESADWLTRKERKLLAGIFKKRFDVVFKSREHANEKNLPVLDFNKDKPEMIRAFMQNQRNKAH